MRPSKIPNGIFRQVFAENWMRPGPNDNAVEDIRDFERA